MMVVEAIHGLLHPYEQIERSRGSKAAFWLVLRYLIANELVPEAAS
jgi:hypothetical protein